MDATSHPDAGPRLPETSAPGGDAALHEEALAVLRRLVDRPDARFKDGQFEAIEALVAHRRRALVVERTGWGKSAVYFVASLLLRARGAGPTLIVSPLLALMRDQVAAARRAVDAAASQAGLRRPRTVDGWAEQGLEPRLLGPGHDLDERISMLVLTAGAALRFVFSRPDRVPGSDPSPEDLDHAVDVLERVAQDLVERRDVRRELRQKQRRPLDGLHEVLSSWSSLHWTAIDCKHFLAPLCAGA